MEDLARSYFPKNISDREMAIFELGIKLAALFHIAVGMPIQNASKTRESVAMGIAKSIECQPYVKEVKVSILEKGEKVDKQYKKRHEFDYNSINGKNLQASVDLQYKNWHVVGKIEYIPQLNYPLMHITKIESIPLSSEKTNKS